MSDETPKPRKRRPIPVRKIIRWMFTRGYAIALMLVVGYAGYMAFRYLADFVLRPAQTPGSMISSESRADVASLRDPQAGEGWSRAPMAHYHKLGRRTPVDAQNGCTIAGCHEPLPHSEKMKVPAFANFHVAFLACQSCHTEIKDHPVKMVWMSLNTGEAQDVPAVLQLTRLLHDDEEKIQKEPTHVHPRIVALISDILRVRGTDHTLDELRSQIQASEPGSPIWRGAIKRLATVLPRYARGDYGARLIPEAQLRTYHDTNRQLADLAPKYLASETNNPARKALDDKIHASVLKKAPGCVVCHSDFPAQLDFAAVGYLPGRAKGLANLQLARQLEEVRQGKEFRLPTLLEGSDGK